MKEKNLAVILKKQKQDLLVLDFSIFILPRFLLRVTFLYFFLTLLFFFVLPSIFVCFFLLSLKYGWRVTRIVAWQRYTGEFKLN